jgi:hypothetical protein
LPDSAFGAARLGTIAPADICSAAATKLQQNVERLFGMLFVVCAQALVRLLLSDAFSMSMNTMSGLAVSSDGHAHEYTKHLRFHATFVISMF